MTTTAAPMVRTWTNVGILHSETPELRARLEGMFDRLPWKRYTPGAEEAMMPALGIRAAINELRIPRVSHYAISNELAPYGLYAIRGHFLNGRVDVYLVDEGSSLVVLASDHWPGCTTPTPIGEYGATVPCGETVAVPGRKPFARLCPLCRGEG
jgi:hypothetical protein